MGVKRSSRGCIDDLCEAGHLGRLSGTRCAGRVPARIPVAATVLLPSQLPAHNPPYATLERNWSETGCWHPMPVGASGPVLLP